MAHRSASFFHATGPHPQDRRHGLWHTPATGVPGHLVVWVPPFAEEMNKSRRMAAMQAHALADAGCAVLQMDLLGCGDSGGEFMQASWQAWIDDVDSSLDLAQRRFALQWPDARPPVPWLWSLRAGCLLATAAARRRATPLNLLFWQPQASGRQVLQQFLRLAMATALGDGNKGVSERLRSAMGAGETVHIAGYALPAAIAQGLEAATLEPAPIAAKLHCLELSTRQDAGPSPVTRQWIEQWQAAGIDAQAHVVTGPAFWSTVEIEEAPLLIEATTALVSAAGGAG